MPNLEKHKKEKKTLFASRPVLTALVKMCFFLHLQFPNVSEMFFDVAKNQKITKYQSNKNKKQQENKIQSTNKSNMMIQNKTRQQAEKKTK